MNSLVTRLAGMRQGFGLAVSIVALLYLVQESFGPPERKIPFMLVEVLLGVTFVVWSVEEHFRGNRFWAGFFSLGGVGLILYAGYLLVRAG